MNPRQDVDLSACAKRYDVDIPRAGVMDQAVPYVPRFKCHFCGPNVHTDVRSGIIKDRL